MAFDERKLLLHEKSYKNGFLYIKYEKNEKKKNIIIDDEEPITQRLHSGQHAVEVLAEYDTIRLAVREEGRRATPKGNMDQPLKTWKHE